MLVNASVPNWNERQRRFLTIFAEHPTIATAARLADVARCTIYRWRENPAFATAMQEAYDAGCEARMQTILAEEAARAVWRKQRERERYPMRCRVLAEAREAKRRKAMNARWR